MIVLAGRGGFQRATIKVVDAINYTHNPKNTAIVLNTPFTILKTLGKKEVISHKEDFSEKEISTIYQPIINLSSDKTFNKKNVVVIILESFGKENIGLTINNKKITPFLDSLITVGRYYENSFANGRRSIDAVPSTITSIPCLMETSYISSPYSFNKIDGFSTILKKQGYNTSFFHGAFNGSQNFNEFAKIANYDQYFGKNEYQGPEAYDGAWGVFDEDFFQFMVKKLTTFKQPFFATVFSISSHDPWIIPAKYKGKFPKGNTEYHESVAYTDYALQRFFASAKKQPWYNNTLFIITPDHTSGGKHIGFFDTEVGRYSIPIVFFDPGNPTLTGKESKLFEQIDILPETLHYLNYTGTIFSFGNNPTQTKNRIVGNFNEGVYKFVIDNYFILYDGEKIISVFDKDKDPMQKNKLKVYPEKELLTQIKAYIQQYNNRLLENKTYLQ